MSHNAQVYDRPRLLFTVDEAAEHLRCSRRTVERLIARGDLVPVHVASRRRLRIEDLDAYLERGREPPHERRRRLPRAAPDTSYPDEPTLALRTPSGDTDHALREFMDDQVAV